MGFTIEDIEKEIAGFKAMIQKAQGQLDSLPTEYL